VFPQPANFAKNLVYGGTAGLIGAACMFPIDTSKTRFQNEKVLALLVLDYVGLGRRAAEGCRGCPWGGISGRSPLCVFTSCDL